MNQIGKWVLNLELFGQILNFNYKKDGKGWPIKKHGLAF